MKYTIYTDGAYAISRDQGGIGIAIYKDNKCILEYNKGYKETTNNQMELRAVITAFKCLKKEVSEIIVISDSQYVLGCITKGWQRKKNKELWIEFDKEYDRVKELCPNITFEWTKGHTGEEGNERVDKLAVQASQFDL